MSQPTPLNPVEQDALVKQIGLALMKAAPQDWEQVRAYYRAAGRYFELSAEVTDQDGQSRAWTPPADTASLFARLRAGMYREGRGTWFNARYQLERPSSYNLDFDRDEPQWQNPPPPMAYTDEMRFFPRTDENVPEWLAGRLQAPAPQQQQQQRPPMPQGGGQPGRLRTARIFDGPGPDGRPSVNRPPLDPAEVGKVLDYLEAAPVVMTAQGMDSDRLAHENPESIPFAFHTDGTWIWPAAVIFYLARYGVPPEPDLVQHIRSVNFLAPEVDEPTRGQAVALLSTMVPNGRPVPAQQPATQMMPAPEPPQIAPEPEPEPQPEPEPEPLVIDQFVEPEPEPEPIAEPEPPAAQPEPVGPSIELLRELLDELNVPSSVYRIGEPSPNTWYLERVEDGWQVGWYEHGFSTPMLFDDDNDAAAFLLGKLLLNRPVPADEPVEAEPEFQHEPEPEPVDIAPVPVPIPPPPPVQPPQPEPPADLPPQPDLLSREPARIEPATRMEPRPEPGPPPMTPPRPMPAQPPMPPLGSQQPPMGDRPPMTPPGGQPLGQPVNQQPVNQQQNGQGPRADEWPIQPLRGEPPLTLFRGKRVIELPQGVEVDRFGQPDGNLTYAGGTPFPLRSLVPEWVTRPYHVYRLQQPVQALAGVAVPWFGQPGGGTAYLLPKSIDELVAEGTLVEVRQGTPPPTGQ